METETLPEAATGVKLREVNREDYEFPSTAYGAKCKFDKDGNVTGVTLPKERFLSFDKPGKRIDAKRLYTVKSEKANGAVVQLPLEGQINNNVASPDNYIGIRKYQKRGFNIFFDFETGIGAFCPARDCWAAWNNSFGGFCTPAHKELTQPEQRSGGSIFNQDATTSGNFRGA